MTAFLCRQIDSSFTSAAKFADLFTGDAVDKIRLFFEPRELPVLGLPAESCMTNLFFGFFFDGTKNNYKIAEAANNHSNVARLYDCYPGRSVPGVLPISTDWQHKKEIYNHFFKVYVPGVASPFPQVGDSGNSVWGAAAGAYGERRIIWALLQAINNVHRYFLKMPLVSADETAKLLRRIVLNKQSRAFMTRGEVGESEGRQAVNLIARREFEALLRRLHAAISNHMPDKRTGKPAKVDPGIVQTIYVSVFGFSRGATQARAFVNWLQSLCKLDAQLCGRTGQMTLGGFKVEFDFVGLFDTVASVGLANTFGYVDGHAAWADTEDSLRIPEGVKCLHLVAAHELRRSFPVDSISVRGVLPPGCEEIVVPGVHSDVGCGYCPREQGRGTDANGDDMLSRIPLLLMYKAARLNGVPLKLEFANLPAKARFALTPETISAYNAYIATCKEKQGPIHKIMREQARKQMEWRLARRVTGKAPLHNSASFLRASNFDKNDLYSAALEFEEEIAKFVEWRKEKGARFAPARQKAGFDDEHEAEWEEIATWWEKGPAPGPEVLHFFDNYVHDSRAWFKMDPSSPDDEKRMHELLAAWVRRRKAAQVHNEMRPQMRGRGNSRYLVRANDGLTEDQRRAADEYAKTGKIPRLITAGREPFLLAGAGYLRFRKVYGGWDSELISAVPDQTDTLSGDAAKQA